ncbi:TrkH family potassium uptake protein [Bacillus piscicola]|uniref:TrkH family potassium uptake protein n=1 Tax=Bacillus piscicola TaxID=1632684 RepID=UPI001F09E6D7|nr:TrkH family potassium uptake protein [Bacillus piscicola]
MNFYNKVINLSAPQVLLTVFVTFIAIGTFLLKLPISTVEEISLVDALFTATSAMTVTGLIVVDTGTTFTLFGEIVIICLIQIGGIGIMTFAVLIFLVLGRKIGFKQRLLIQQALNQTSIGGVVKLVKLIFVFSITVEAIALTILSARWIPEYGLARGFYYSLFHSVSAFNNAGFSIWSDSLMRYVGDPIVNLIITFLIIVGGIGFTVLVDLWTSKEFSKMSLHTKMMLVGTLIINIVAFFLIFLLEYNNPETIGNMSQSGKLWASYFQAVTPRTAGFNTVDIGSLEEPTVFFILLLMFIGAGSASTGGGIKLTTFIAMLLTVTTFLKNRSEIVLFRRSLNPVVILRSLAIAMISIGLIFVAIFILVLTEDAPFMMIVFEVISAFGTVGLSMGLTGALTTIGKVVIIIVMFVGKLGPLTLAFSIAKQSKAAIRYPKEEILTG